MGDLQRRLAAVVQTLPDAFTETFGAIKEMDEYTLGTWRGVTGGYG
jgi:hypothetical protein